MEIDFGSAESRRLPVYIVVDVGADMAPHIQTATQCLELICNELLAEPQALEMVHISLITNSDTARQVNLLTPLTVFKPPLLVVNKKRSDLGTALGFLWGRIFKERIPNTTLKKGDFSPLVIFLFAHSTTQSILYGKINAEISLFGDEPGSRYDRNPLIIELGSEYLGFDRFPRIYWEGVSASDFHHISARRNILRAALGIKFENCFKQKASYFSTQRYETDYAESDLTFRHELGISILGSSCRGMKHKEAITFREDAFDIGEKNGWIFIAVADGSSKSNLARIEANFVAPKAIQAMQAGIPEQSTIYAINTLDARVIILNALSQVYSISSRINVGKTTLLLLAYNLGLGLIGSCQIGDGLLIVQLENRQIELLGEPKPGEYFSDFFDEGGLDEIAARVHVRTIKNPRMLLAMTDGIADDFYPPKENLLELINAIPPVLSAKEPGEALLELIQYERPGSDGDRTLVVVGPTVKETAKPFILPTPPPGFEIIL